MAPSKHPCIICAKNVTNQGKDGSIACCVCHRWNHNSCTDLHPEALKYFNKMWKEKGHHFYSCEGCSLAYHELNMRVAEVNEKLKVLSTDVARNTESNKTTSHRVDQVVIDVDQVKKDVKASKDNIVKETTKAWSSELREREQLKSNIVIYGLAELDHKVKTGITRKDYDYKEAQVMFKAIGAETDLSEKAKFVYRIGELTPTVDDNPRPLKIGFRSLSAREMIFDKARNLPKTMYKDISIVPDLTSLQRQEDKELKDEADQLNQDMEEEEALNWHYRCVGKRGERVIRKLKVTEQRGQGVGRGGRGSRGPHRGGPAARLHRPHADHPRPRQHNTRTPSPRTQTFSDSEEELETDQNNPTRQDKRRRSPTPLESEEDRLSSPGHSGTSRREKRSKKAMEQNH